MADPGAGTARCVRWTDLGRMAYDEALDLQRRIVAERKAGQGVDQLLVVEHPPVITLGRRGDETHVLADRAALAARGIRVFEVERGGDVTYHGPGQLVAYPILDLRQHRKDVRWFSVSLLNVLVKTLQRAGIDAYLREGPETGVWVDDSGGPAKIGALGVRVERWVTYHGVALNVDPDLADFETIVPCGLTDARTTSMGQLLGRSISVEEIRSTFLSSFGETFGVRMAPAPMAVLT